MQKILGLPTDKYHPTQFLYGTSKKVPCYPTFSAEDKPSSSDKVTVSLPKLHRGALCSAIASLNRNTPPELELGLLSPLKTVYASNYNRDIDHNKFKTRTVLTERPSSE